MLRLPFLNFPIFQPAQVLGFSGGGVFRVGFGDVAQSDKSLIRSFILLDLDRPGRPHATV